MSARDKTKTMLCRMYHELFHVLTLKLVNKIFSIRQSTNNTFQAPVVKSQGLVKATIVNISVEILFQTLRVFTTTTS